MTKNAMMSAATMASTTHSQVRSKPAGAGLTGLGVETESPGWDAEGEGVGVGVAVGVGVGVGVAAAAKVVTTVCGLRGVVGVPPPDPPLEGAAKVRSTSVSSNPQPHPAPAVSPGRSTTLPPSLVE